MADRHAMSYHDEPSDPVIGKALDKIAQEILAVSGFPMCRICEVAVAAPGDDMCKGCREYYDALSKEAFHVRL